MARVDRNSGKEQFWRGMVRQWDPCKQTVREFCVEHGVSEPSFYAWRRTIAKRDRQAAAELVSAPPVTGDRPTFVPVQVVAGTAAAPMLEVMVNRKRVIRVPADFDATALRRLLAVLEDERPC
jgi:hypothetical protein